MTDGDVFGDGGEFAWRTRRRATLRAKSNTRDDCGNNEGIEEDTRCGEEAVAADADGDSGDAVDDDDDDDDDSDGRGDDGGGSGDDAGRGALAASPPSAAASPLANITPQRWWEGEK